ncbi:MAG: CinA family protein [FCB group bacterium]|jgi:PncC family amidohydrolase|nr:CinA family protein [FCB group bacterium]
MDSTQSLEEKLARRLGVTHATVATAESCTGGLVAHRITNIAGSSSYFLGGVVTYSNEAKERLLDVPRADLEAHGAVSDPVARAMAEGARKTFGAEWGIGITGIAGPGGGTAQKPVGLVYIAVAGPAGVQVSENRFQGSREHIKAQSAERALGLLLEQLA